MIDHSEPRSDICYVAGCWEVTDVLEELFLWFNSSVSNLESNIVNLLLRELEFSWVEDHSRIGTNFKKVVLDAARPKDGVVHTSVHVFDSLHDYVGSLCVTIS